MSVEELGMFLEYSTSSNKDRTSSLLGRVFRRRSPDNQGCPVERRDKDPTTPLMTDPLVLDLDRSRRTRPTSQVVRSPSVHRKGGDLDSKRETKGTGGERYESYKIKTSRYKNGTATKTHYKVCDNRDPIFTVID